MNLKARTPVGLFRAVWRTLQASAALERGSRLGFSARWRRGISVLLIVTLTNMTLLPFSQALALPLNPAASADTMADTVSVADPAGDYGQVLAELKAALEEQASMGSTLRRPSPPADYSRYTAALEQTRAALERDWAALRKTWHEAGISTEIVQRQQQIERDFAQQHGVLLQHLVTGTRADGRQALLDFLQRQVPEPTHHPIDLKNLPWQVQKNQARAPIEDPEELARRLAPPQPSAAAPDPNSAAAAAPTRHAQVDAPTPADRAPTLDAPQTAAIQKQAADLSNNPHKLYQWVHDQIYFFPSYGSVQGAQDTLDKKSGNAFDTASLLIAMLRSAGIAARYVYGTVELPVDAVKNWVGGVETPEAAQQILGQGGIPNIALTAGGQIKAFRLEHVWVEAYLDYDPSRGAKPGNGPKVWVPMDPSFKQYTFTAGMDLQTAVPFDAQSFLDHAQQGATVNETEGWVQHLNQANLQHDLNAYQQRFNAYLDAQKGGNATVGDVLGSQTARIDKLPYLADTLPYPIKATAARYSQLPPTLRQQFRYRIYPDAYSYKIDAPALLEFQAPTATLAGKKLTLAWVAASEADQKAIEALLPKPHADGSPIQPSELPRGLPASIQLKPQLRVDGQIKAEGYGLRVGAEPIGAGAFTPYANPGQWDETSDPLIVGQQSALGLSIQGISAAQLNSLKTRMETTKTTLQQAQAAPEDQRLNLLKDLTGENLTGDLLTATLWGYFANHL